jgi:hypothetical protein
MPDDKIDTEPKSDKKGKRLRMFKLVRQAADKIDKHILFDDGLVPVCCWQQCRHFDGKRCSLIGEVPEYCCHPVVGKLVKLACSLDLVLFEERGPV